MTKNTATSSVYESIASRKHVTKYAETSFTLITEYLVIVIKEGNIMFY